MFTQTLRVWTSENSSVVDALTLTGTLVYRSPSVVTQSPEDIPPIDPRAVLELELYARRVAQSLDAMMGNLNSSLHKVGTSTPQGGYLNSSLHKVGTSTPVCTKWVPQLQPAQGGYLNSSLHKVWATSPMCTRWVVV